MSKKNDDQKFNVNKTKHNQSNFLRFFLLNRNVELPFVWALLEPVLYTREDFAKQTQPIEIERIVSETSSFHVEPNRGTFPPLATVEFRLIFAPSQVIFPLYFFLSSI